VWPLRQAQGDRKDKLSMAPIILSLSKDKLTRHGPFDKLRANGDGAGYSWWRRTAASTGPRAARRPCDFWYSSMSAGAVPPSGQAQSTQREDFEQP
jgi:hypothetical protein